MPKIAENVKKAGFHSIGANIRKRQESRCLPYAGFFLLFCSGVLCVCFFLLHFLGVISCSLFFNIYIHIFFFLISGDRDYPRIFFYFSWFFFVLLFIYLFIFRRAVFFVVVFCGIYDIILKLYNVEWSPF